MIALFTLLLSFLLPSVLLAAVGKSNVNVTGYVIDLQLDPANHAMTATAQVTFTAPATISTAVFELHNALKVDKVTDAAGHPLAGQRGADTTIGVVLPAPMNKGASATFTFHYSGTLTGGEDGPVEGLKLASIGDPISYLLYAARWFPMAGYQTDRFTAEIHVQVPQGYRVVGSGSTGAPHIVGGLEEYDFNWTKPGFPGTIIAGKFNEPMAISGSTNVRIYLTDAHKDSGPDYAQTAAKEFDFLSGLYGPPESSRINIVELPDDTVPDYWGPEVVAIAGARIADRSNFRLLANTMAHQWWGSMISPASFNDAWITNGMARYSELLYVENVSGKSALQAAITDVAAGALAYDTIPLTSAGTLDPFSPQFQSMTLDKGAMVFHMLRWEVGEDAFDQILKSVLSQYTDKPVRSSDFEKVAEAQSHQELTPFFAQWLDGTGAPQFTDKYTIYRLGNNKGFRTIGEIQQDLDLFNMPVELSVETEGKTEDKRIDVVGTDSQYSVDTFGRPRQIIIDPNNWVLKNSSDLQVRVAILRGQQLVAQGDNPGALAEYQKALTVNPQSSLASYRIGEILFTQRNYQAAANAYRDALRGDDDPKWTEVWSHIALGKIFDVTGQRDRAVNEYRQAVQTNDNTGGAINAARQYLQTPFKRPDAD
ncbi:MAG TPA: M1 family aminopeptidase [Acidobacteriaceae bacterium]|nr:M1 family aminopeptidase [Acidobacteriaceae bacterium]